MSFFTEKKTYLQRCAIFRPFLVKQNQRQHYDVVFVLRWTWIRLLWL